MSTLEVRFSLISCIVDSDLANITGSCIQCIKKMGWGTSWPFLPTHGCLWKRVSTLLSFSLSFDLVFFAFVGVVNRNAFLSELDQECLFS